MNEQTPEEATYTYAFAPLLNFSLDTAEVRLARGVAVRLPSDEEKQAIEELAGFHAPQRWGEWDFIASSASRRKSGEIWPVSSKCMGELFDLCRALKLFKRGPLGLGPQFQMDKTTKKCLLHGGSSIVFDFRMYDEKYSLLSVELPDFESFNDKFCQFDFSRNRRLHTAILRFDLSYDVGLIYKPIDLMIAFEALYLAEEQELAYKLATRAAYLLGNTQERRNFIYSALRNAYILRSKLVHGGDIPHEVKIAKSHSFKTGEFVLEVEDLLRESIKKFMDLLARYSHKQLLTTLLDNNVLAGGGLL